MTLTVDPSTPVAVAVTSGNATTAPFTAPADSVIVVCADVGSTAAGGSVGPFITDTGGLGWLLIGRIGGTAVYDETIVWAARPVGVASRTITVVGASANQYPKFVQPLVFDGADLDSTIGAVVTATATGLMSASLTCSRTDSQLWVAYADWDAGAAPTPGAGVTRYSAGVGGTTGAVLYRTAPGVSGTTMSVTTTAPTGQLAWVAFEVRPASTSNSGSGAIGGTGLIAGRGAKAARGSATVFGTGSVGGRGGSGGQVGSGGGVITGTGVIAGSGRKRGKGSGTISGAGTITGRPIQGGVIYATPNPDFGRMNLQVAWSGAVTVTNIDVVRSTASGETVPVRGGTNAALTSAEWLGADYEAPTDVTLYYSVTPHGGGSTVMTPAVTLPSNGAHWLKSPGRPLLNIPVTPAEGHLDAVTSELPQGIFKILGRRDPIPVSMRRWGPTTTLKLLTYSDAERRALRDILDDGQVLYYSTPGDVADGDDSGYVAIGQADFGRIGYPKPERLVTLAATYVGRPSGLASPVGPGSTTGGGDSSGATYGGVWADVLTHYQTWADVVLAKDSWTSLETNIAPASDPAAP